MATFEDMAQRIKHMSPEEIAVVFSQLQRGQLVLQDGNSQEQDERMADGPPRDGREVDRYHREQDPRPHMPQQEFPDQPAQMQQDFMDDHLQLAQSGEHDLMASHDLQIEQELLLRRLQMQREIELQVQQEMVMRGVSGDLLRERLLQSRLSKALESSTSDEQANIFAARMMGASGDRMMGSPRDRMMGSPGDRMMAGPSDPTDMEQLPHIPLEPVIPPHLLEDVSVIKQKLQQGDTQMNAKALDVLAQLGRQLREQQQNREFPSQPERQLYDTDQAVSVTMPLVSEGQLYETAQIPAPVTLPLVSEGHMVSMSEHGVPETSVGLVNISDNITPSSELSKCLVPESSMTSSSLSMMPMPQTVFSDQGDHQPAVLQADGALSHLDRHVGPDVNLIQPMIPNEQGFPMMGRVGSEAMGQESDDLVPHTYGFHLQDTAGLTERHIFDYFSQFGLILNIVDKIRYAFIEIDKLTAPQAQRLVGFHMIEGIRICVQSPVRSSTEDEESASQEEESATQIAHMPARPQSPPPNEQSECLLTDLHRDSPQKRKSSRSPQRRSRSPRSHSPNRRSKSPRRRRALSPRKRSRSSRRRSRSPRRRSRSPRRRSRSPSRKSKSPHRSHCSKRRRSRTPADRKTNEQEKANLTEDKNKTESVETKANQSAAFKALTSRPIIQPKEKPKQIPINIQVTSDDLDPNKWKCHVCNIVCKAQWSWDLHLKGSQHKEKVKADSLKQKDGSQTGSEDKQYCDDCMRIFSGELHQCSNKPKVSTPTPKKWHCEACDITCKDQKSYNAHLKTMEHEVSVKYNEVVAERQAKEAAKQVATTSDAVEISLGCDICDRSFTDQTRYDMHKMSLVHQLAVERWKESRKKDDKIGGEISKEKVEYVKDSNKGHNSKIPDVHNGSTGQPGYSGIANPQGPAGMPPIPSPQAHLGMKGPPPLPPRLPVPPVPLVPPIPPSGGFVGPPPVPSMGFGGPPPQPPMGFGGPPPQPPMGFGGPPPPPPMGFGGPPPPPPMGFGGPPPMRFGGLVPSRFDGPPPALGFPPFPPPSMAIRGTPPVPPRGPPPLMALPGPPPSSEVSKNSSSEVKNPEPTSPNKSQPPPPGVDGPQSDPSEYQDVILGDGSAYDISENQDGDFTAVYDYYYDNNEYKPQSQQQQWQPGQEPGSKMMGGPPAKKVRRNSDGVASQSANQKSHSSTLKLIGVALFSREQLEAYFSKFGPVEKFSHREDGGKTKSGFGSIRYKSQADAEKAFQCGDVFGKVKDRRRHYIGDKFITVQQIVSTGEKNNDDKQLKQKGEDKEKEKSASPEQQMFIWGLNQTLHEQDMFKHFRQFGEVIRCSIVYKRNFGFVRFKTSLDYTTAFNAGRVVDGVSFHQVKGVEIKCIRSAADKEKNKGKIYMVGYSDSLRTQNVREYFLKYGKLVHVELLSGKGAGYVQFEDPAAALKVLNSGVIRGHQTIHHISGEKVFCQRATCGEAKRTNENLPVSNLKRLSLEGLWSDMTEADVWDYFESYGEVVDVKVIPNSGFGHVEFRTTEEAQQAMFRGDKVCDGISKHYIRGKNFTAQLYGDVWLPQKQESEPNYCRFKVINTTDLSTKHLKIYFAQFGKVIDLMQSKWFSYVEFDSMSHSTQEKFLQPHIIDGIEVLVERARPKKASVKSTTSYNDPIVEPVGPVIPNARFYIGNVQWLRVHDLRGYFSKFGPVVDTQAKLNQYGFVEYSKLGVSEEKKVLGRHVIQGIEILVERARQMDNDSKTPKLLEPSPWRYYLGDVEDLTEDELRNYFLQFGPIAALQVIRSLDSKCFAFLTFERFSEDQEVKFLREHPIHGKNVKVFRAKQDKSMTPSKDQDCLEMSVNSEDRYKFHVSRIRDLTKNQLGNYFGQYGQVIDVFVRGKEGERKPYGFVQFDWLTSHNEKEMIGDHNIEGCDVKVSRTKSSMVNVKGSYRYHIKGIKHLQMKDLRDYFCQFGRIVDVKTCQSVGLTRPYGFVEFDCLNKDVQMKLAGMHKIKNVMVRVELAKSKGTQRDAGKLQQLTGKRTGFHLQGVQNLLAVDIHDYFSTVGRLVDINMRDTVCFVEYADLTDKEEMEVLGTHSVKGITVRVQRRGQMQPSSSESTAHSEFTEPIKDLLKDFQSGAAQMSGGNSQKVHDKGTKVDSIVMSNIPKPVTEDDVHKYFQKFGDLDEVKVMKTKKLGFGFVQFKSMKAVELALSSGTKADIQRGLVLIQINTYTIDCEREIAEADGEEEEDDSTCKTLYVYGIPKEIRSKEVLSSYFAKFGKILSSEWFFSTKLNQIVSDQFVIAFEDGKSIERVINSGVVETTINTSKQFDEKEEIARLVIGSYPVYCKRNKGADIYKADKFYTLFIRKVSIQITEEDLATYFGKFGTVELVMLGRTNSTSSENIGVGVVKFLTQTSLDEAVKNQKENGIAEHLVKYTIVECEAVSSNEINFSKLIPRYAPKTVVKRARCLLKSLCCHCHLCYKDMNNHEVWTKHLQLNRHLYRDAKIQESHVCELCKICFRSGDQLSKHLTSMRHEEIARLQEFIGGTGEEKLETDVKKDEDGKVIVLPTTKTVRCHVCKCDLTSENCFRSHSLGRSHKENLDKRITMGFTEGSGKIMRLV
ncbi:uncharacterized protein [Amphiura filiformis]|uniref:uncharacterized protein n=1 Tax=Amphiura filiformis TaxID=82378 RepID=UPI003B20F333